MVSPEERHSLTDRRGTEVDCISTLLESWAQPSALGRPVRFSRDWRVIVDGSDAGGCMCDGAALQTNRNVRAEKRKGEKTGKS